MANSSGTLFIISDRTGITLEHLVRTLVTQFDELRRERIVLPFLDTPAKIAAAVREIDAAGQEDGALPVVFSSVVDEASRALLQTAHARVFDIFDTFLPALSDAFGMPYKGYVGRSHGIGDLGRYDRRVAAVSFALNFDDGARLRGLGDADVILIGVSRSGKTPTCLYLAMQYAVLAANFPLTEDDFLLGRLPDPLLACRSSLFGLTISADRLNRLREERRPGSAYASLSQCRKEIAAAEDLFQVHSIPFIDSTTMSIEELAIEIMQRIGVSRQRG